MKIPLFYLLNVDWIEQMLSEKNTNSILQAGYYGFNGLLPTDNKSCGLESLWTSCSQ